jgi:hypothetical protein
MHRQPPVFQASSAGNSADFNVHKYEEAEELRACRPEVNDNVAIDHQREDSGSSVAVGFPLFREMNKTLHPSNDFEESSSSVKKADYFLALYGRFYHTVDANCKIRGFFNYFFLLVAGLSAKKPES